MLAALPQELAYEVKTANNSAPAPKGRNLEKIQSKTKRKLALLVLLVLAAGFSMTFLATQTVIKGYQVENIKKEINTLQRENERLQLEVARLKTPERIAEVATVRLGMVEPQTSQFYYIPGSEQAQMATTATIEPLVKEIQVTDNSSRSWLLVLSQTLQQLLNPVRIAGAGG